MHCIERSRFVEWARDPENYGDLYHEDFFYRLVMRISSANPDHFMLLEITQL